MREIEAQKLSAEGQAFLLLAVETVLLNGIDESFVFGVNCKQLHQHNLKNLIVKVLKQNEHVKHRVECEGQSKAKKKMGNRDPCHLEKKQKNPRANSRTFS